ncbi:MAG: aminotransferase class V-fold PLP-dependent enzyme [Deltaproteobacteria bacterium]|jgi:cysteine desulfurase family protein|nr:aminotransferase class V-fold PLP-dependent enzyme [Deltaproteobacteria bacterium]
MPIYLDNAATSFPKPASVVNAVMSTLQTNAANPGRGGHHLALDASRMVMETREAIASFFGIEDAASIVFTSNATEAINLGLFGLLKPGDRVVTTSMEHNAVIRPLKALEACGVNVVKVQGDAKGFVDPDRIRRSCRDNTRLVVMNHCSNVSGTLQAIEEIGPWCRQQGIVFMVDAAQSAGLFPIDVEEQAIDLLAVPGHKALMGPPGTGFLYVRPDLRLKPLIYGGTGTRSSSDSQPEEMPERLESGTLNTIGLAGLKAALEFIVQVGMDKIRAQEQALLEPLIDGLRSIQQVVLYGPIGSERHGGALSINLMSMDPATLGFRLDREYGICCRVGLHCAPDAHRTLGTYPEGTVRLSPGYFNTISEIEQTLVAVRALATGQ